MQDIHTGNSVLVTAPALPDATHVFAGKTGQVTCVKRSIGTAMVLIEGASRSVEIPLSYLTRADDTNDEDDDLTGLISRVANPDTLAAAGWKNPSNCANYKAFLKFRDTLPGVAFATK